MTEQTHHSTSERQQEIVKQILIAWYRAESQAEDNAKLLLLDTIFTNLCSSRMAVANEARHLLWTLEDACKDHQDRLPEEFWRFARANKDKGCPSCWLSSNRKSVHNDGSPSCHLKIKEWFDAKLGLMDCARTMLFEEIIGNLDDKEDEE